MSKTALVALEEQVKLYRYSLTDEFDERLRSFGDPLGPDNKPVREVVRVFDVRR